MATPYEGRYVILEGGEGSGKGTQAARLLKGLESVGVKNQYVREPGGTPFGEWVRLGLLTPSAETGFTFSEETERDMFMMARRELGRQVIRQALIDEKWVVADRSWMSTVAYQGFGRGLDVEEIIHRAEEAMGDLLIPDSAYIIDIDAETSIERNSGHADKQDRIDVEGVEFKTKVREGYLWLAERYEFEVIDGLLLPDEIEEIIWEREKEYALAA